MILLRLLHALLLTAIILIAATGFVVFLAANVFVISLSSGSRAERMAMFERLRVRR